LSELLDIECPYCGKTGTGTLKKYKCKNCGMKFKVLPNGETKLILPFYTYKIIVAINLIVFVFELSFILLFQKFTVLIFLNILILHYLLYQVMAYFLKLPILERYRSLEYKDKLFNIIFRLISLIINIPSLIYFSYLFFKAFIN